MSTEPQPELGLANKPASVSAAYADTRRVEQQLEIVGLDVRCPSHLRLYQ